MSFLGALRKLVRKSGAPDWGVLERYLAWVLGGGAAASGIVVNPQTAMQCGAVFACIKVLSEGVGMLPCRLWRGRLGGAMAPAFDHPLYRLLAHAPNEYQTCTEFFEMVVLHICLRGNSYSFINRRSDGVPIELLPLHPDAVRCRMGDNWRLQYTMTLANGAQKDAGDDEILHIKGQTLNGWEGLSPIAYARESIGLAISAERFGSLFFKNGAKASGVLEHPGQISEEAQARIKKTFDESTSGDMAHSTGILEEGMKYNKIQMTAEDAQFLETRKYQRSEIASIYRVPAHKINDLEKATYSNIEQQSLEFVQDALMPWFTRIERAIKRDLIEQEEEEDLHIRFAIAGLLRGDQAARSAYYHNGIADGWLTRNEVRMIESDLGIMLNPVDGLDVPLRPLNMADGRTTPTEPAATPPGSAPALPPPAKDKLPILELIR